MADEEEFNELDEEEAPQGDDPAGSDAEEAPAAEEGGEDEGEGAEEGEEGEGAQAAGSVQDSSEEEDDEENEYELGDGFIVDEVDEEGEGEGSDGDEGARKRRRKKKRQREFRLDEDDYALLEDNQVVVRRPAERKRLKKRGDEEEGQEQRLMGAQQLKASLFGEDDFEDEDLEDERAGGAGRQQQQHEQQRREEEFDDMDDEMADFIDDGDDGGGGARQRRRRRHGADEMEGGLSSRAMQEAAAIFGNVDDLLDLYQSRKAADKAASAAADEDALALEDEVDLDEADFSDEEAAQQFRADKEARARARKREKALSVLDPELVAAHHLTSTDQEIRDRDTPERLQLLGKLAIQATQNLEAHDKDEYYQRAAEWVHANLFAEGAPKRRVKKIVEEGVVEVQGMPRHGEHRQGQENLWKAELLKGAREDLDLRSNRALREFREDTKRAIWHGDADAQRALIASIKDVLMLMFERHEEVPLIAMYRKEACGELLALRSSDEPNITKDDYERSARFPAGTIQPKHRRIRRWEVLWAVHDFALKWFALDHRRITRGEFYNKAMDIAGTEEEKDAISDCLAALYKAASSAAVDDCDQRFRLVVAAAQAANAANGVAALALDGSKRPQRSSAYKRLVGSGLQALASRMALSPKDFSENLEEESRLHEPVDPRAVPLAFVVDHMQELPLAVGAEADPAQILREVKELMAIELAALPKFRDTVRMLYFRSAVVTTQPTESGNETLDPFHRYGIVKRLRGKRLDKFVDDQWLRLTAAQAAGLIKVTVEVPADIMETALLARLYELYTNDDTSDTAKEWNKLRREVVHVAVVQKLLPSMYREVGVRLLAEAKEHAIEKAIDSLWDIVKRPPLRLLATDIDPDIEEPPVIEAPRIMACCWGEGSAPTMLVQLDGSGNLVDFISCGQLSGNIPRSISFDPVADPKKARDAARIGDKILEHLPHAIIVGAGAPQARQLKDDVEKISQYMEQKHGYTFREQLENQHVEVLWGDERVASLWASSPAAAEEFPEHGPLLRKAVALGRMALDPLAVLASLCGRGREVLSLRLHDCQDRLPKDELMHAVEQVMVTAVCQVGGDINAMAAQPWRSPTLQFVAGLGPRKAAALLKAVQANENHIESRLELKEEEEYEGMPSQRPPLTTHILGRKVFINAAPFLRVRAGEVAALANYEFERADDTRVHPQHEGVLQALAEAAVEAPDVEKAISDGRPQLLQLDLWDFASQQQGLQLQHKLATLLDIHAELLAPYGELRVDAEAYSEEDVFLMLHGETKSSLKVGRLVEARVVYVGKTFAKVHIQPAGMEALLAQDKVKRGDTAPNLDYLLQRDQVVPARIIFVGEEDDPDRPGPRRFVVRVATAGDELMNYEEWERKYCQEEEAYYHVQTNDEKDREAMEQRAKKAATKAVMARRPIQHPLYALENIKDTIARMELPETPVPSFAFRPNLKAGMSAQLTSLELASKVHQSPRGDALIVRAVVLESKKPERQLAMATPLFIEVPLVGKQQYDDLDEVIASYAEPLAQHYAEVAAHRRFMEGKKEEVDAALWTQKRALVAKRGPNAADGMYAIGFDYPKGRHCIISWCGSGEGVVYHEYFVVIPNGFYFRNARYSNIEKVVSAYKSDVNYVKKMASGMIAAPPQHQQQQRQGGYGMAVGAPPSNVGGYGVPPVGGYGAPGGGYQGAPVPGPPAAAAAARGTPAYGQAPASYPSSSYPSGSYPSSSYPSGSYPSSSYPTVQQVPPVASYQQAPQQRTPYDNGASFGAAGAGYPQALPYNGQQQRGFDQPPAAYSQQKGYGVPSNGAYAQQQPGYAAPAVASYQQQPNAPAPGYGAYPPPPLPQQQQQQPSYYAR